MFKKIAFLEIRKNVPVVKGSPNARALDMPPAKNVDVPVKSHNFASILKGKKDGNDPRKLKVHKRVIF